jgi:Fuc2NAc and GlcNAc transferase
MFWLTPAAAALGSFLLTRLVRRYALARLLDLPNARSSHSTPTPRGGGLAIVLSFLAGTVALTLQGQISARFLLLLATALPVAAVGFWDDHGHVPARLRIMVHTAAAGAALCWLGGFELIPLGHWSFDVGVLGSVGAVLWLVWMLNLFNFMDGIDAIEGTEVIFVGMAAAGLMMLAEGRVSEAAQASLLLAAATAGFQVWNWPPAKIFMGDVGSGFVGYVLAALALADMQRPGGGLGLPVWLILNGVFLVDATYTLLRRMSGGQRWYQAHRSHAYQKAAVRFGGHRPVVTSCMMINLFWLLPWASVAVFRQDLALTALIVSVSPLVLLARYFEAGRD